MTRSHQKLAQVYLLTNVVSHRKKTRKIRKIRKTRKTRRTGKTGLNLEMLERSLRQRCNSKWLILKNPKQLIHSFKTSNSFPNSPLKYLNSSNQPSYHLNKPNYHLNKTHYKITSNSLTLSLIKLLSEKV